MIKLRKALCHKLLNIKQIQIGAKLFFSFYLAYILIIIIIIITTICMAQ